MVASLVVLVAVVTIAVRARAQRDWDYVSHDLTRASKAEIEQAALDWTLARFEVRSGSPSILLSGAVTREQLPLLGLSPISYHPNLPPLYLVFLEGDFDVSNMRGGFGPGGPRIANYVVYILDLHVGAPMKISASLDGSHFNKLLNAPPALPDEPILGDWDPENPPPIVTEPPVVPPGRDEEAAIQVAMNTALSWGEPDPRVISAAHTSHAEYRDQLKVQGDDVQLAGSGEVWIVTLGGEFTIKHGPAFLPRLQYPILQVVIEAGSQTVLSAGGRDPISDAP